MKLDLAAVADQLKGRTGKVRAEWSGGQIEIDEQAFVGAVADAAATVMGQNLFKGLTPDGSGPMPGRKKDGKPRGQSSNIARALNSVSIGVGVWLIAAHKEIQGHLARIMQEIPLKAPPLASLSIAIRKAFERAVSTSKDAPRTPGFASSLAGQGARVYQGGKRVAFGRLFKKGSGSAFDDMPSMRAIKRSLGKLNGPRAPGPRPRKRLGGIGGYL